MKTISTFVTLFLIVTTCATSAVLFLNENYTISAGLTIVWIISLGMWIKSTGMIMLTNNSMQQA